MTLVGIFDGTDSAQRAEMELVRSGISRHRITVSAHLTADGIAAEAPGQSYEHQSYRGSDRLTAYDWLRRLAGRTRSTETDRARYNEAVRTGACLLSVNTESREEAGNIDRILRKKGARVTMERPAS